MVFLANIDYILVAIGVVSDHSPSLIVPHSQSGHVFSLDEMRVWSIFYILKEVFCHWYEFELDVDAVGDPWVEVFENLRYLLDIELFLDFGDEGSHRQYLQILVEAVEENDASSTVEQCADAILQ